MFGRIFDAAEDCLIGYGSGHADYEEVSQPLVEEQFGRDARVRAGEHRGNRVLARCNRCARCRSDVYRVETALAGIAGCRPGGAPAPGGHRYGPSPFERQSRRLKRSSTTTESDTVFISGKESLAALAAVSGRCALRTGTLECRHGSPASPPPTIPVN